ncbi:MAG: flagellar FliJ family protein [Pseudomonadales bacterium]
MAARRSTRMASVARVQHLREQRCRATMIGATGQYQRQHALRLQLEGYRDDYLANSDRKAAAGTNAGWQLAALRNSSQFVTQLARSIERQLQHEAQTLQVLEAERSKWRREAARLDALRSLVERCRVNEERELAHREDLEAIEVWQSGSAHSSMREPDAE